MSVTCYSLGSILPHSLDVCVFHMSRTNGCSTSHLIVLHRSGDVVTLHGCHDMFALVACASYNCIRNYGWTISCRVGRSMYSKKWNQNKIPKIRFPLSLMARRPGLNVLRRPGLSVLSWPESQTLRPRANLRMSCAFKTGKYSKIVDWKVMSKYAG